jgi:arylsulfatase A-like enzyme
MDYEIGRFIDSLTADQKVNTTFIFLGDNGTPGNVLQEFPAGRGKQTLYQGGVHVPMFISGKGVTRIGEADSSLINVIDVYASVLEMLGKDLEGGIYNSYSFNHLLTGTSTETRKYNFTELDANAGSFDVEGYTIRDDTYKLIIYSDNTEELFDLSTDTFELINL